MRKLGLIGGTGPESTVPYYRGIVFAVQRETGNFPPLTIESVSVFDVLRLCGAGEYEKLTGYLLDPVDLFPDSEKFLHQVEFLLISFQNMIAAPDHIMHSLTADAKILRHFAEGKILQDDAFVNLLLTFRKKLPVKIIQ